MWRIIICGLLAAALAACGGQAPATQEGSQNATETAVPEDIAVEGPEQRILAFGDSLFAAYGLEDHQGYPAQLEQALRASGINARIIDAGVSGDTTAAGLQRFAFTLDELEQPPELAIIELGGNDLLRGVSPEESKANLEAMLQELAKRDVPALLMGMRAPPNYGPEFQAQFDGMYSQLAEKYDAALVPFFLEPIYDKPDLFQSDRIHPTAEGISQLVAFTRDAVKDALPEAD